MTRTPDEIVAHINAIKEDDFLAFGQEVLIDYLPYSHAKEFLKDSVTEEQWDAGRPAYSPVKGGVEYLKFAVGKALDHRGISASRSVDKLRQFAWLAEREDVVAAIDEAGYSQYGVPKLCAFALGFDVPTSQVLDGADMEAFTRMSIGEPCRPGCPEGCGR